MNAERKVSRVEELYAEEFGHATLEKQRILARTMWPCCGEPRAVNHHPECSKRVPEQAVVIPGQETLA